MRINSEQLMLYHMGFLDMESMLLKFIWGVDCRISENRLWTFIYLIIYLFHYLLIHLNMSVCWANMWIWINYTCTWSWCINKETIIKKLPDLKTWDMICYHDSPLFKICLCIFSWLSNKLTWLTAYKTIITEQTRDFNQQCLPSLFWRWLFRRLTLH